LHRSNQPALCEIKRCAPALRRNDAVRQTSLCTS
jgi:hypothetical protein